MKTGFESLDKVFNIADPQVILLTGTHFADILSGDIANNICLKQEYEVLEIVSHKKEYLIKRMIINNAMVDYQKWTNKTEYTNKELEQIGKSVVELIEGTKRLPTIIEQDMNLYNLKQVTKLVSDWANDYADCENIRSLIVLDLYPLNSQDKKKYKSGIIGLFKDLHKISKKLRVPIIVVLDINFDKKYNKMDQTINFITKKDIDFIDSINKFIDKTIIINLVEKEETDHTIAFKVDVFNTNSIIGNCKLIYDYRYRIFRDYEQIKL